MQNAKRLHARIIVSGRQRDELPLRQLLTLFTTTAPPSINHARCLFDHIDSPSTYISNTMIRAYASSSNPDQALNIYAKMRSCSKPPNSYTFPFLIKACSSNGELRIAESVHCEVVKSGFGEDVFVGNALVSLYGGFGRIGVARRMFDEMGFKDVASWTSLVSCYASLGMVEFARKVFDEMPERNVVSYSAMIAGYCRKSLFKGALELFRGMLKVGVEANDATFVSVIAACAGLGALDVGRWVYRYVRGRRGGKEGCCDSRVMTALIDMFFKCGCVGTALEVFKGAEKGVGEWTAVITGLAMHGLGKESIQMFEDMVGAGVRPNSVTFVALLSGCAHAGLVDQGLDYFENMKRRYGVEPVIEHFGCVVDLLGRAGLIGKAVQLIQEMPHEANAAVWGALLNACRVYKNVEIGEIAANWLIKDEPWNGALYMTLLNLYLESGRWDEVENVKAMMTNIGCTKAPGCSLIEVNGTCYEFVAGDTSDSCASEMCSNLAQMIEELNQKS